MLPNDSFIIFALEITKYMKAEEEKHRYCRYIKILKLRVKETQKQQERYQNFHPNET